MLRFSCVGVAPVRRGLASPESGEAAVDSTGPDLEDGGPGAFADARGTATIKSGAHNTGTEAFHHLL
jgi:hypothetical protein